MGDFEPISMTEFNGREKRIKRIARIFVVTITVIFLIYVVFVAVDTVRQYSETELEVIIIPIVVIIYLVFLSLFAAAVIWLIKKEELFGRYPCPRIENSNKEDVLITEQDGVVRIDSGLFVWVKNGDFIYCEGSEWNPEKLKLIPELDNTTVFLIQTKTPISLRSRGEVVISQKYPSNLPEQTTVFIIR